MGKIIRFRGADGTNRTAHLDLVQLRHAAGLDRDQHIATLRQECGWRFPASMYLAWEAGTSPPRRVLDVARRLAGEPALDGREAGTGVNRRDFLRSSSLLGLAGTAASVGWTTSRGLDSDALDRLSHVLDHPCRVDSECLQQLERATILLQRQEGESRSEALLGSVKGHLAEVMQLIRLGSMGTQVHEALWTIAGETAGTAGWLTWQCDDKAAATAWFEFGLEAASNAHNRALGAYLVGCLATQPHYREDPGVRLQHLTGGPHGFNQLDAAPSTRAWLATMEAEAHALMGRARDAAQALDRAHAILNQAGDFAKNGRPMVLSSHGAFFSHDYLAAEEGVVRAKLGDNAAAISILVPLLRSIEPHRRKNWYWLYPMLASAHLHQDNVEDACQLALESLRGSMAMNVATNLPLISGVRKQLDAHAGHPAVRELDHAIREARDVAGW